MSQLNPVQSFMQPESNMQDPVFFTPGMTLKEIEKNVILETLKHQRFNRTRTARVLQIGIRTLQRKLKQYKELEMQTMQQMDSVAN